MQVSQPNSKDSATAGDSKKQSAATGGGPGGGPGGGNASQQSSLEPAKKKAKVWIVYALLVDR